MIKFLHFRLLLINCLLTLNGHNNIANALNEFHHMMPFIESLVNFMSGISQMYNNNQFFLNNTSFANHTSNILYQSDQLILANFNSSLEI